MNRLQEIAEGFRNSVIPPKKLKGVIEEVSAERLKICEGCKWHSKNHKHLRPDVHCFKCKCNLGAKTKCLHCNCPLEQPKWTAINETP